MRKYLELPHGIPSHNTFARVFAKLDPEALGAAYGKRVSLEGGASGTIEWLPSKHGQKGLRSICAVRSKRIIGERKSEEVRYFISSLPPTAETLGDGVPRG